MKNFENKSNKKITIRNLSMNKKRLSGAVLLAILSATTASTVSAETFRLEKRDTNFSIDGNRGAINGQQVYLWNSNSANVNQQWEELEVNDRFTQYRKVNTSLCLDGQSGGRAGQAVILQNCDSDNRDQHWEKVPQTNGHTRLKKRGVSFSIDCQNGAQRRQTCELSRSQDSNVNQHFEFISIGGGSSNNNDDTSSNNDSSSNSGGTGAFNLDPSAPPWENFDLTQWKIDTPAGEDSASDCQAQGTEPQDWENNFPSRSEPYFFTHTDGGMRFVSEIGRATTGGSCTSRTRSELREMLRGSDTSINTNGRSGDYRNNWALGYQPENHAGNRGESWGARGGIMRATLRVNQVTTQGSRTSIGRTVIGQIHANNDEPLRLNYKHRAGFEGGCIYASSEQNGGDDTNFILAGDGTSCDTDPGNNGLGLNDLFSYQIENRNEDIIVTIYEGNFGDVINRVTIDLNEIDGGYDLADDWMYFKAGAYTQNAESNGGRRGDGDIVTFYHLDVTH